MLAKIKLKSHSSIFKIMTERPYQICSHCVLDTQDAPDIVFDSKGVCNYCLQYESQYLRSYQTDEKKQKYLSEYIQKIKKYRNIKKYDSILGISGGVDSTYLAYLAKQFGLNPLVVHFDNGWNSELAVKNIENTVSRLGFDLFTYVVNWEEFKNLQLSYIKAGVLDWEIPTDHGFYAMLMHEAYKHNIKYVLTGHNYATESILPKNMRWSKMDVANIYDIHRKYGTKNLKTFPILTFFRYNYYRQIVKIVEVPLLNYVDYTKARAKEIIIRELSWRDYMGKHCESVFTRFYQGYVLPERFKVDKRKAHLSNMICSGQITREEALEQLKLPTYDPEQLKIDKTFVIKKFGLTEDEFEKYMQQPIVSHLEFKSYETGLYRWHEKFFKTISPFTRFVKTLIGKK